jgi:hypothetical protein
MALNTEPLTPTRRAVLVLILLAAFVGSLGLAQMLVVARRTRLAPAFTIPPQFPTALTTALPGLYAARSGTVGGQPRKLYYFFYDHVPGGDFGSLRAEARRLYVESVGMLPDEERFNVLAGHPAVEERGEAETPAAFAFLRFTVVADRAVAILYSGSTAQTDADEGLFNALAERLHVVDLTPHPRPSTRGTH